MFHLYFWYGSDEIAWNITRRPLPVVAHATPKSVQNIGIILFDSPYEKKKQSSFYNTVKLTVSTRWADADDISNLYKMLQKCQNYWITVPKPEVQKNYIQMETNMLGSGLEPVTYCFFCFVDWRCLRPLGHASPDVYSIHWFVVYGVRSHPKAYNFKTSCTSYFLKIKYDISEHNNINPQ